MKYISILRGINVSGQKKIRMEDLRSLYKNIGLSAVETYIQSGNVIFNSDVKDVKKIIKDIQNAIEKRYKFYVPVQIRTQEEFEKIIKNFPFGAIDPDKEGTKYLVTFLADKPSGSSIKDLYGHVKEPEKIQVIGQVAYIYCPGGYGKSKLSNNFLEKKLKVEATTRNWKTIIKLFSLSCE